MEIPAYAQQQPPEQANFNSIQTSQSTSALGALSKGYPNAPWECPACLFMNSNADRMECERCESMRPPPIANRSESQLRSQQRAPWQVRKRRTVSPSGSGDPSTNSQGGANADGILCFSQESVERVMALIYGFYELYKLLMASLLIVFVPQKCYTFVDGVPLPDAHICSASETLRHTHGLQTAVIVLNFVTLGVGFIHQVLSWSREAKFIDVLDEDPTVGDDYLIAKDTKNRTVLQLYPHIADLIAQRNSWTFHSSSYLIVLFIANAIASGYYLFEPSHSTGYRTITTFITNLILLLAVVGKQWNLSRLGWSTGAAYSFFDTTNIIYNNIDRRFKADPQYFVPRNKQASAHVRMIDSSPIDDRAAGSNTQGVAAQAQPYGSFV